MSAPILRPLMRFILLFAFVLMSAITNGCCIRWNDSLSTETFAITADPGADFKLSLYRYADFSNGHENISDHVRILEASDLGTSKAIIPQDYVRSFKLRGGVGTRIEFMTDSGASAVGRVGPNRKLDITDLYPWWFAKKPDLSETGDLGCKIVSMKISLVAPAQDQKE